ncbi:hypothetical protein [Marinobacterium sp. BA1]|uniref:hypothetical protein n=1 Tax=Marinobacterium sp. BA1 TaxID=3138931 RepID=UPI0032E5DE7C
MATYWPRHFRRRVSINNLFDKQYLSHASVEDLTANPGYSIISGYPEAGRDIRLSAKVRF